MAFNDLSSDPFVLFVSFVVQSIYQFAPPPHKALQLLCCVLLSSYSLLLYFPLSREACPAQRVLTSSFGDVHNGFRCCSGSGACNLWERYPPSIEAHVTIGEHLLQIFVCIAIPLILIGVPVFVFTGGVKKFARKPLLRCFEGVAVHERLEPGDVEIVYHSYRGFLIWFVQTTHRVFAPPDDALVVLKRLLRFNLSWGMLSYMSFFIPFLAVGNYVAQKRSIERQRQELAA